MVSQVVVKRAGRVQKGVAGPKKWRPEFKLLAIKDRRLSRPYMEIVRINSVITIFKDRRLSRLFNPLFMQLHPGDYPGHIWKLDALTP